MLAMRCYSALTVPSPTIMTVNDFFERQEERHFKIKSSAPFNLKCVELLASEKLVLPLAPRSARLMRS